MALHLLLLGRHVLLLSKLCRSSSHHIVSLEWIHWLHHRVSIGSLISSDDVPQNAIGLLLLLILLALELLLVVFGEVLRKDLIDAWFDVDHGLVFFPCSSLVRLHPVLTLLLLAIIQVLQEAQPHLEVQVGFELDLRLPHLRIPVPQIGREGAQYFALEPERVGAVSLLERGEVAMEPPIEYLAVSSTLRLLPQGLLLLLQIKVQCLEHPKRVLCPPFDHVLLDGPDQAPDGIQLVDPPLLLPIPVAQLLFIVNELMIAQGLLGLNEMRGLRKIILSLHVFFFLS